MSAARRLKNKLYFSGLRSWESVISAKYNHSPLTLNERLGIERRLAPRPFFIHFDIKR